MAIPAALTQFNIQNAGLTVWLFKKSGGSAGLAPTYTGRWITTQPDLEAALKASLVAARARITEVHEYGLLAQNNEASALLIDTVETHAGLIVAQSANPVVQKKVKSEKEVTNTSFFVVRLTDGDKVLLSVRKPMPPGKVSSAKGLLTSAFATMPWSWIRLRASRYPNTSTSSSSMIGSSFPIREISNPF
ncbi:hypothetical protein QP162_07580 [Sphingomonas aurantiaca]|uniref:hypothetical protein n=1 Tax=Sphingomonas aurantiaca TaxID=185949 RepID=UPI002FE22CB8